MRPARYDESYIEALDCGGWDEVFPSVAPCSIRLDSGVMRPVPDHGDLVRLPWSVDRLTPASVGMSCECRFASVRFRREIETQAEGFVFRYEIESADVRAIPWQWCAHPLIAIERGMVVRWGGRCGTELGRLVVPDAGAPGLVATALKFFTAARSTAWVEVCSPARDESLRLAWDPVEIEYLGLWVNLRGWSGCGSAPYFNLGIEPTTAPFDSLREAIDSGLGRLLEPGGLARWALTVSAGGSMGA